MTNEATQQSSQTFVNRQEVSLGCGTLILIALIVIIFSKGGDKTQLEAIDKKLNSIEQRLERIEKPLPVAKKVD